MPQIHSRASEYLSRSGKTRTRIKSSVHAIIRYRFYVCMSREADYKDWFWPSLVELKVVGAKDRKLLEPSTFTYNTVHLVAAPLLVIHTC